MQFLQCFSSKSEKIDNRDRFDKTETNQGSFAILAMFLLREGEPLPPVYKVFSTKPLDEGDLSGLFQPLHSYQVDMVLSIME